MNNIPDNIISNLVTLPSAAGCAVQRLNGLMINGHSANQPTGHSIIQQFDDAKFQDAF